jgi:hypothetical protein
MDLSPYSATYLNWKAGIVLLMATFHVANKKVEKGMDRLTKEK